MFYPVQETCLLDNHFCIKHNRIICHNEPQASIGSLCIGLYWTDGHLPVQWTALSIYLTHHL